MSSRKRKYDDYESSSDSEASDYKSRGKEDKKKNGNSEKQPRKYKKEEEQKKGDKKGDKEEPKGSKREKEESEKKPPNPFEEINLFLSKAFCRVNPVVEVLKNRIIKSGMPDSVKETVLNRLKHVESDGPKQIEWIESILKVPWGKYSKIKVTKSSKIEDIKTYFKKVKKDLDEHVYGMEKIKEEIINYVAQFISTDGLSMPRVLGLVGPAGVGKTRLLRHGLAPALGRPIKSISMGGIRDSSHFVGFDYTYSGSRYGILIQSIMESGVMNPIIFMDELDKISLGHEGLDVQNMLVHLTDPVQNNAFHDKYFTGIPFDLSKCVFVFSFNDEQLIHPILKDRLHIIRVPSPTIDEKINIGKDYLTKEISPNIGCNPSDIQFTAEVMRYLINQYCADDKGIRGIKKCMESIYLKINSARYIPDVKYKTLKNVTFPFVVTKDVIDECVEKHDDRTDYMKNLFI